MSAATYTHTLPSGGSVTMEEDCIVVVEAVVPSPSLSSEPDPSFGSGHFVSPSIILRPAFAVAADDDPVMQQLPSLGGWSLMGLAVVGVGDASAMKALGRAFLARRVRAADEKDSGRGAGTSRRKGAAKRLCPVFPVSCKGRIGGLSRSMGVPRHGKGSACEA